MSDSSGALRVLIAEDDPINQKLMEMMLQRMGHLSETAEDGQIVLEKLRQCSFDVLLLDMRMPVMDGYEVLGELRREQLLGSLLVIAITGGMAEGEEQSILEAGCDDYMAKPVDQQTLSVKLAKAHSRN